MVQKKKSSRSELQNHGFYHVRILLGVDYFGFWNLPLDTAVRDYFGPFYLGEVKYIDDLQGGQTFLLNYRAVARFSVKYTNAKIQPHTWEKVT